MMSRFPLTKSDHISIIWNSFHHINVNNFHMNFTINIYVLCDINNMMLQIFFGYKKKFHTREYFVIVIAFYYKSNLIQFLPIWHNKLCVSIQFYMWNDVIRLPQDKHLNDDTHTIITSFLFFSYLVLLQSWNGRKPTQSPKIRVKIIRWLFLSSYYTHNRSTSAFNPWRKKGQPK